MRRTFILLTLLLPLSGLMAQNTPDEYMKSLPPLPDNPCILSEENFKVFDGLHELIDRMKELLSMEERAWKDATRNGKFNMAFLDAEGPSGRKAKALGAEAEKLREDVNIAYMKIQTPYIEACTALIRKYEGPVDELKKEYRDAQAAGRNTSAAKDRITAMEMARCAEITAAKRVYFGAYREFLHDYMPKFVRQNEINDEINRLMYLSFEHRTRYGAWLEMIKNFAVELERIFEDAPDTSLDLR